jgi:predicted DNA-binding transcriptional regulator AlpA
MHNEISIAAPKASEVTIESPNEVSDLRPLPNDPDVLIRAAEVPKYVGIAKQTLNRWRHQGNPPKFVRLGRRVFYRAGDLREWIRSQVCENTIY